MLVVMWIRAARHSDGTRHRGSYISALVLFNVLNQVGKSDKMRGLSSILSLFCSE